MAAEVPQDNMFQGKVPVLLVFPENQYCCDNSTTTDQTTDQGNTQNHDGEA